MLRINSTLYKVITTILGIVFLIFWLSMAVGIGYTVYLIISALEKYVNS